jgi:EthD domain-containing protein
MEKLVYLLWRGAAEPEASFAERLERAVGPKLADAGARSVAVSWAHAAADLGGSVPIRETGSEFHGLVSFWLPCVDDRGPCESILRDASSRLAGYLVTESVPRDFDQRSWRNGVRSPGAKLITVFEQPARLTRDEFIARWHGSHTPLSLQIHPMWRYVRNVVARPLTPDAPNYAGIVEEHFRELADITDPARFYGGKDVMAANIKRVIDDVRTFLDLERVTSIVASENILS